MSTPTPLPGPDIAHHRVAQGRAVVAKPTKKAGPRTVTRPGFYVHDNVNLAMWIAHSQPGSAAEKAALLQMHEFVAKKANTSTK